MHAIGPDFIALQVHDLEGAARFYESQLGLTRAPQAPPGAVVFDTEPAFAVRDPLPGTDLDAGPRGLGVALWLAATDVAGLHARLSDHGVETISDPAPGPFGLAFTFRDPEGYAVTVHEAVGDTAG